ncbi:hypothetical protein EDB80DRAFT_688660 [Ilyonectria destructans]|nr:hypothetical protein EDB80DRAFT_688660 [Ilyonectria destructans]
MSSTVGKWRRMIAVTIAVWIAPSSIVCAVDVLSCCGLTLKSCAGSGKASGVRGGRSEGMLSKSGNVDRNRPERERKGTMAEAQNGYGRGKGKGKEGAEAEKEEKAEVRKERIKKADAVCWRGWIDGNDGQTNFWGLTKFGRVVLGSFLGEEGRGDGGLAGSVSEIRWRRFGVGGGVGLGGIATGIAIATATATATRLRLRLQLDCGCDNYNVHVSFRLASWESGWRLCVSLASCLCVSLQCTRKRPATKRQTICLPTQRRDDWLRAATPTQHRGNGNGSADMGYLDTTTRQPSTHGRYSFPSYEGTSDRGPGKDLDNGASAEGTGVTGGNDSNEHLRESPVGPSGGAS